MTDRVVSKVEFACYLSIGKPANEEVEDPHLLRSKGFEETLEVSICIVGVRTLNSSVVISNPEEVRSLSDPVAIVGQRDDTNLHGARNYEWAV
ncbi:MAG: hypothetical protein QOG54_2185 [Actinomycetota bacterium]|nr:hypothetical protein [Actinomycetota bacterium]